MRRTLVIVGAVLLLAMGCGDHRPAEAPSRASASPVKQPLRYGAPDVRAPRDLAPVTNRDCSDILTALDLKALALEAQPRREPMVVGDAACVWEDEAKTLTVDVSIYPSRDILADTYRAHLTSIFTPLELDGLPAVSEKTSSDAVICGITVGTASNQGIEVTWYGTGTDGGARRDPCGSAAAAARRIVVKLPPR